jgi:regulator of nucleoside diphosphate kinase
MLLSRRIVSASDNRRLADAVDRARRSWQTYAPYLDHFRDELRRVATVAAGDVPGDVITINSRFAVTDPRVDESICYTLVYPDAEALGDGRVSVLSPMGMAMLGARVGDEVCWHSADGPEAARVDRLIYQPEAAGDLHL